MFTCGNHICIATRDIDRAVRVWWDKYGVGPWPVFSYDATVDGRPTDFRMRAALAQIRAQFNVEIIQPLDDRGPYAKSLTEHGDADHIHHVLLDVADFADGLGRLRELGLESIQHGQFNGASADGPLLTTPYLATEADLGSTLEIARVQPGFSMAEPDYVYPSDA
jgi:hypothetical protein